MKQPGLGYHSPNMEISQQVRPIKPALFRYTCSFFSIVRGSPEPSRVTRAFQECLLQAHAGTHSAS